MARDKSTFQKLKQDALAIWGEQLGAYKELPRLHKFLHFSALVVKSFVRNRCPIRASALSFTSLLALIPMLAVAISITSALLKKEGEDQIYRFVDKIVSAMIPAAPMASDSSAKFIITTNAPTDAGQTNLQPSSTAESNANLTNTVSAATNSQFSEANPAGTGMENLITQTNQSSSQESNKVAGVAVSSDSNSETASDREATQKEVAKRIHEFIRNTRSGTIGTVGGILLVLVGIRMLRSVESTFNDIWGVSRCRNWLSTIQIYCTLFLIGPTLLAGAAALARGPHLETTKRFLTSVPFFGPLIFPTLALLTLWLLFTLFYYFVPNTKVRFKAALIGGLVGGTIWHVNNLFGFLYVSRVVSNSRIYGGLGLIPVFMAGIYFSWLVLLFGAQVSYAYQNRALYLQERLAENVNQRGREFVALRLMTCIGQQFQRGLRPPTVELMSEELAIPGRLVHQVLQTLVAAHLVIEIAGAEPAFTPGRPLEQINAHHILQAMRARGQELLTRDEPIRQEVYGEFARIEQAEKLAASSVSMLALVTRADARLELVPPSEPMKEILISPALVPTHAETIVKKPVTEAPMDIKKPDESMPIPRSESVKSEENNRRLNQEQETPISPVIATSQEAKPSPSTPVPKPPVAEPIPDDEREFPL